MPRERQIFGLQLAGLDTKTDPRHVVPGRLVEAENVVFTTPGQYRQRNGHDALSTTGIGRAPQAVTSYRKELVLGDGQELYSYSPTTVAWTPKGTLKSTPVHLDDVVRDGDSQSWPDGNTHIPTGNQFFAWENEQGDLFYRVIDGISGGIVAGKLLVLNGIKPKVLVVNDTFVLLFFDTSVGQLKIATLSALNPTASMTVSALTTVTSSADTTMSATGPVFDATVGVLLNAPVGVYVIFNNDNGGTSVWYLLPTALHPTVGTPAGSEVFNSKPAGMIASVFFAPATPAVVVSWADFSSSTPVYFAALSQTLGTLIVTALPLATGQDCRYLVGLAGIERAGVFWQFWLSFDPNFRGQTLFTEYCEVNNSTFAVSGMSTVRRGAVLASKLFDTFAPTAWMATPALNQDGYNALQNSYFLIDYLGHITAKGLQDSSGFVDLRADGLFGVAPTEIGPFPGAPPSTPLIVQELLNYNLNTTTGDVTTTVATTGIVRASLSDPAASITPVDCWLSVEMANNLHVSGGFLSMYDGKTVCEHGFFQYPMVVGASGITTMGSTMALGKYGIVACFEWTDSRGQIHRSAPSIPKTFTLAGGDNDAAYTITTLRLTAKETVKIGIYRTIDNGITLYLLALIDNDPAADTVSYTDSTAGLTDDELKAKLQCYAQPLTPEPPAGLENGPAPSCSSLCAWQNRLVLLGDQPNTLWYSKTLTEGVPVEFNETLQIIVNPLGGSITAVAPMDDKLILFAGDAIYYVAGPGLDNTGQGTDFPVAQLITSDCGCTNPHSIVVTPFGLMFQSAKGKRLLDRGLIISYPGADVDKYNDANVTAAILTPNTNEVRFYQPGPSPVFDTLVKQWTAFSGLDVVDACVWQGKVVLITSDGLVLQESETRFTDAGAFVSMRTVIAPLSLAGVIQGYMRVRRLFLWGDWMDPHVLQVQAAHDSDVSSSASDATWTQTATQEMPAGTTNYQWRIGFVRQKCDSVQVAIQSLPPESGPYGESFRLSGITFEFLVESGPMRLPPKRSFS